MPYDLIRAENRKGETKMKAKHFVITAAILLVAGNSLAQDGSASNSWRGKHHIQLGVGLLSDYGVESEVSFGSVSNVVGGEGFFGSVAYDYWIDHNLAIGVSVGLIGSEVSTSVSGARVSVETASVVPLMFGIKYQPWRISGSNAVRPFVFASAGPFVGSGTRTRAGVIIGNETFTETVLGSNFGLGADVVLSRLFVLGVRAGYYLVSDFDSPIGSQKNYSSPEFTLSFGILLGKGKE